MADTTASMSRHILLPLTGGSLRAQCDPIMHTLTLHAEGTARTSIHDIHFIELGSAANGGLLYALKAWASDLPVESPYKHTEHFRSLQPYPLKATVEAANGIFEIDIQIVYGVDEKRGPIPQSGAALTFNPAVVPSNGNAVYAPIGATFVVKEPIDGGSVTLNYDREFLGLVGANVRDDTIYYKFEASKLGRTEVVMFRSGRTPKVARTIVDVIIFLPPVQERKEIPAV